MKTRRSTAGDTGPRDGGEPDAANGRHVPAEIRRAVWGRDEGRFTFADADGRRCHERAGLEIHHEHAFALGGTTTLENLRLLCRAHNALLAERDFGREHIERMKNAALRPPRRRRVPRAQKRHSPPAPIVGPA